MTNVSAELSQPTYDDLGPDEGLEPIEVHSPQEWEAQRAALRARWNAFLGTDSYGSFDRTARIVEQFELPQAHATLLRQPTSPETEQLLLLLEPKGAPPSPRPGAIVPYYHPDLMSGYDMGTKAPIPDTPNKHFGRHLVEQGYVVVCTEAFPYNTVPDPQDPKTHSWWRVAADHILAQNPRWTGMGKLVWDVRLATDLLLQQPDVDPQRIVIIGHSLGGKMAFYNGCLDERIGAIIASDFGIGWRFTNWQDPWYLGEKVLREDVPLAHHQLLALNAPRSFLLIAGRYDGPESWQYINAVRPIYQLYGREHAIGCFDHGTGHNPTDEAMILAYRWLAEQFGLPERPWQI